MVCTTSRVSGRGNSTYAGRIRSRAGEKWSPKNECGSQRARLRVDSMKRPLIVFHSTWSNTARSDAVEWNDQCRTSASAPNRIPASKATASTIRPSERASRNTAERRPTNTRKNLAEVCDSVRVQNLWLDRAEPTITCGRETSEGAERAGEMRLVRESGLDRKRGDGF